MAVVAGLLMIGLSLLMLPFSGDSMGDTIVSFLLRDVVMIFGLGIVFVSMYVDKKGKAVLSDIGFSNRKIKLSLVLDILLAAGLLAMFMGDGIPEGTVLLQKEDLYAAAYILTAGIFEMLFIYGFLRMSFEKAFGIIPAILLTSVFYSFHHAGFQPEFLHLFLVGLMYCAVFYITRNMLVIFPKNVESFVFAMIIWLLIVIWLLYRRRRSKRNAVENIHSDHGDPDQGREKCV